MPSIRRYLGGASPGRALARRLALASLAMLLLAQPACRGRSGGAVSDSTFVRTMAALYRIDADAALDSAARATARRAVLRERGLTPQELARAAERYGRTPARAAAVWRAIGERARADSARRRAAPRSDDRNGGD